MCAIVHVDENNILLVNHHYSFELSNFKPIHRNQTHHNITEKTIIIFATLEKGAKRLSSYSLHASFLLTLVTQLSILPDRAFLSKTFQGWLLDGWWPAGYEYWSPFLKLTCDFCFYLLICGRGIFLNSQNNGLAKMSALYSFLSVWKVNLFCDVLLASVAVKLLNNDRGRICLR